MSSHVYVSYLAQLPVNADEDAPNMLRACALPTKATATTKATTHFILYY